MSSPASQYGELSAYGRTLRCLRRQAGLSQEQLAEAAGVCATTIGNSEGGLVAVPRLATHALIREALRRFLREDDLRDLDAAYHTTRCARWRGDLQKGV